MIVIVTAAIPMVCYAIAAVALARQKNYYDALMFFGYALAGVGILLRLA